MTSIMPVSFVTPQAKVRSNGGVIPAPASTNGDAHGIDKSSLQASLLKAAESALNNPYMIDSVEKLYSPGKSTLLDCRSTHFIQEEPDNPLFALLGIPHIHSSLPNNLAQALYTQGLFTQKVDGRNKLYMKPLELRLHNGFALADSVALTGVSVDPVVKTAIGLSELPLLLTANGHRFISPKAKIHLEAQGYFTHHTNNTDLQIFRRLINEWKQNTISLIADKAGLSDRKKISEALLKGKSLTAIEALLYGTKGLIDGIVVGPDKIITRTTLENYLRTKAFDKKQLKAFCKHPDENILSQLAEPITNVYPNCIPEKRKMRYYHPKTDFDSNNYHGPKLYMDGLLSKLTVNAFNMPSQNACHTNKPFPTYTFETAPTEQRNSIFHNDAIFYTGEVTLEKVQKMLGRLTLLDDKKSRQSNPNNHRIILNSPGGLILGLEDFSNHLKLLKQPVDILATGMVASAAALMTATATTGKRMATPFTQVMLHQSSQGLTDLDFFGDRLNHAADQKLNLNRSFFKWISEKTGRPLEEVRQDFTHDYFVNSLEALFYGSKGLIDAIVVSPTKIITRDDVKKYMVTKLGSEAKLNEYVEKRLHDRRLPLLDNPGKDETFDEQDPFSNPYRTIQAIAGLYAKPIQEVPGFEHSGPDKNDLIDHINITDPVIPKLHR